jgi:hypothetical protein
MELWSNGEEKTENWKNGVMKNRNMIYKGCNQHSNAPILQYSICIHLGAGRFLWIIR